MSAKITAATGLMHAKITVAPSDFRILGPECGGAFCFSTRTKLITGCSYPLSGWLLAIR